MQAQPQAQQEDHTIRISSPDRVARIIHRIVQGGLPLVIRQSHQPEVAVKGKATRISQENGLQSIRISEISDKGIAHIVGSGLRSVSVEFALSASKLVFVTPIIARETNTIIVQFPGELQSIERRKNSRFPMTQDLCGYLTIERWDSLNEPNLSPPTFLGFEDQSKFFSLGDISHGGMSLNSRFPGVALILKRGTIEDRCHLHIPMEQPIPVTLDVRWVKKIKETVTNDKGEVRQTRHYKFGLEFKDLPEPLLIKVKQFIQRLNQSTAI